MPILAGDERGNVTRFRLGKGVETVEGFDPASERRCYVGDFAVVPR